ncbi:hypothetical protein DFH09DRAFT_1368519 [Mycena vulgaris]|nr:hypothetical protein DFH09DRAFT_1368519 [Mycena vulgaris]
MDSRDEISSDGGSFLYFRARFTGCWGGFTLPDLSETEVVDAVRAVAPTLRCLELDCVDEDAFPVLLVHIRADPCARRARARPRRACGSLPRLMAQTAELDRRGSRRPPQTTPGTGLCSPQRSSQTSGRSHRSCGTCSGRSPASPSCTPSIAGRARAWRMHHFLSLASPYGHSLLQGGVRNPSNGCRGHFYCEHPPMLTWSGISPAGLPRTDRAWMHFL